MAPLIKAAVAAAVLAAVGHSLRDAAEGLRRSPLRPDPWWALASAAACPLAFLPMGLYWRRLLSEWGQPAERGLVLRSYYLGHLGKYVPGKAMVVLLRTGALRAAGGQTAVIAASVFVETLTLMAVGGVISGVLLLLPQHAAGQPAWLVLAAFGLAAVSAGPVCPPVMNYLIGLRSRRQGASSSPPPRLAWRMFGVGWLAAAATWVGLSGSLWLAARSLTPDIPLDAATLGRCLLATTLPVVAGFLSLIPGGLLVRDALMATLLAPAAGPEVALAATVTVRLGWIGSEAAVCGILAVAGRWSARGGAPPDALPDRSLGGDRPLPPQRSSK